MHDMDDMEGLQVARIQWLFTRTRVAIYNIAMSNRILFLAVIIFLTAFLFACGSEPKKESDTNGSVVMVTPESPSRPKFEPKGSNSDFVIATNAEATLLSAKPPKVWLETRTTNTETATVKLPESAQQRLDDLWNKFANYHAAMRFSSDPNKKIASKIDLDKSIENLVDALENVDIDTLDGRTRLSRSEADEVASLQAKLFSVRLTEILNAFPNQQGNSGY